MKTIFTVLILLIATQAFAHDEGYLTMSGVSNTSEFGAVNVTLGYRSNHLFAEGYSLKGGAIGIFKEINDWRFNVGIAYTNKYTPIIGIDYKGISVKITQYTETTQSTEQRYVDYSSSDNDRVSGYYPSLIESQKTGELLMIGYTLEF